MALRINIGCGQSPTQGWRNFDNSFSLRLSKVPLLPALLLKLKILKNSQYEFIGFARNNDIEYADATKGLPLQDESVDVLYSSHMLEHLDRGQAAMFLKDAFRVIKPSGIIRVAVPDMRIQVEQYCETNDCDAFVEQTYFCVANPRSFSQRLRLLLVGNRHHQWMYVGDSLSCLLQNHGFVNTERVLEGRTRITNPGSLDLRERAAESVYVEAEKPSA